MVPSEEARYGHRAHLLREAEQIITQDRNKSYGAPDEDFQRIAAIASAMGFVIDNGGDTLRPLTGSDVARFMIALKLSRLSWNPGHRDSWLDIAGYAACGFETATLERDRMQTPEYLAASVVPDISEDIIDAARNAVNGAPAELEEMGYILVDEPGRSLCSLLCDDGHTFRSHCQYRIKARRHA